MLRRPAASWLSPKRSDTEGENVMDPMKVCTVQMRSVLGDVAANCQKIISQTEHCIDQGARLVCFPEACLTGYSADRAAKLAIDAHDPAV